MRRLLCGALFELQSTGSEAHRTKELCNYRAELARSSVDAAEYDQAHIVELGMASDKTQGVINQGVDHCLSTGLGLFQQLL